MLPILATIPSLPHSLFLLLTTLIVAVAAALTLRNVSALKTVGGPASEAAAPLSPLYGAAFGVVMLWAWSRNPIKLHSYGLMLIIGFLVATVLACREAKRRDVDPNIIVDLALPLLLISIVCCRVLYILLNRGQFADPAQMIRIWDGGLSFHGAFVGAISVIAYFGWRHGLGFWKLGDIIAPGVFAGYAIGRLGCFLNGCCYGHACDLPWKMIFPVEGGPPGAFTEPSHPAQIYSFGLAMLLFWVMQRAKVAPSFNRFAGQITLLFLSLYAVERFVIEIFRRGATARTVLGTDWLTEAQLTSLLALAVIGAVWMLRSQSTRNRPAPLAHPQS